MIREISRMSNLLFGVWVLSIMVAVCSFIVTWVTLEINEDLVKENLNLRYERQELVEIRWKYQELRELLQEEYEKGA